MYAKVTALVGKDYFFLGFSPKFKKDIETKSLFFILHIFFLVVAFFFFFFLQICFLLHFFLNDG